MVWWFGGLVVRWFGGEVVWWFGGSARQRAREASQLESILHDLHDLHG